MTRVVQARVRLPVVNRKATQTKVVVATSVRESEFKGRRYLWPVCGGCKARVENGDVTVIAPEGALVWISHYTGTHRRTMYRVGVIARVREGAGVKELTNFKTGEKVEAEGENLEILAEFDWTDEDKAEAELKAAGYALPYDPWKQLDSIAAWMIKPYLEKSNEEREKKEDKEDRAVAGGTQYYLVAWDLSMANEAVRRRFYRRLHKAVGEYLGRNHVTLDEAREAGAFIWAQQSVVITSDADLARKIYQLAVEHGVRALMGRVDNVEIWGAYR